MNRSHRKAPQTFASKADTKELRDYQRLASQYPPLTHEEIVALSRKFVNGRNCQVELDEYRLVDTMLGGKWEIDDEGRSVQVECGDWDEVCSEENEKAVIQAYRDNIGWLSNSKTPSDFLYDLMPENDKTVSGLYSVRMDNIFEALPWIEPLRLSDVEIEIGDDESSRISSTDISEMTLDDFKKVEGQIVSGALSAVESRMPRHTPKDVVDRWKSELRELVRHYGAKVRPLNKKQTDVRRMKRAILIGEESLALMINHNLQLAMSRVGKMMENNQRAKAIGVFELIGAANVGLVLGARQFDPEMGKKFSTYAAFHIDGQLHDLVNREDGKSGILGMSLHEQKQLNSILAIKHTFTEMFDREPTMTELQSLTGISKDIIVKRMSTPQVRTQNIYAPVSRSNDDNAPTMLADTLTSEENDVDRIISKNEYHKMVSTLKELINNTLSEKERRVIMARTGFTPDELSQNPGEEKKPRKVSNELGMSVMEVNSIYASALSKLKDQIDLHGWTLEDLIHSTE